MEKKKKENNENEIKQKPANEAKPTERKNTGVTEIKEQAEREDTSGKRNAINGYKKKATSQKGKSDRYHSNQSKDKQKNEQNDKKVRWKKFHHSKKRIVMIL